MKIITIHSTLSESEEIEFEKSEEYDLAVYEVQAEEGDPTAGIIDVAGIRIVIPELGLSAREGTFYYYNEEEDVYEADFTVTLIYEKDERDPAKYLYWEQDGVLVSLYNFLRGRGEKIEGLGALEDKECVIELEEEE